MKAPIPKCKYCNEFLWSTDLTISFANGITNQIIICPCGKKYRFKRQKIKS